MLQQFFPPKIQKKQKYKKSKSTQNTIENNYQNIHSYSPIKSNKGHYLQFLRLKKNKFRFLGFWQIHMLQPDVFDFEHICKNNKTPISGSNLKQLGVSGVYIQYIENRFTAKFANCLERGRGKACPPNICVLLLNPPHPCPLKKY